MIFVFLILLSVSFCLCTEYTRHCSSWTNYESIVYLTLSNRIPQGYRVLQDEYDENCRNIDSRWDIKYTVDGCVSLASGFMKCNVTMNSASVYISSAYAHNNSISCNNGQYNNWQRIENTVCRNNGEDIYGYMKLQLNKKYIKRFFIGSYTLVIDETKFEQEGSCPMDWWYVVYAILGIFVFVILVYVIYKCYYYCTRIRSARAYTAKAKKS